MTRERGRGGHGRGHEVGTSTGTLTALKVAVRSRSAALTGGELVRVHAEAHGATGLAPVEAGLDEDAVESLRLGLRADESGTGDDHGVDALGDLAALDDESGGAEVLDARVGAGSDEYLEEGV